MSLQGSIALTNKKATVDNPITLATEPQIQNYIQALIHVYGTTGSNQELVEIKLLELLQLIKSQSNGSDFLSFILSLPRNREKRRIKPFMLNNYLKNLKIEDYALLTGRSLSSFIRDFKRLYDTTPHQWLIQKRLEKAYELLTTTKLNVTETAFEVGYENLSHFIKAYKKQFGCTPSEQKKWQKIATFDKFQAELRGNPA